jgi:hypothetical protein
MSEKHTAARIKYYADMDPQERSARMAAMAHTRQSKLTFKQRRDNAMKMVEARNRNKRLRKEAMELAHRNGIVVQ